MHHLQGILDQDLDHDLPRGPLTPVVKKKKKAIPQPFRFYSLVPPCPTRSGSPACANFTLLMSGLPSPSALAFLGGTGLGVWGGEQRLAGQHCPHTTFHASGSRVLNAVGAPSC